jgi:hypothetical protein
MRPDVVAGELARQRAIVAIVGAVGGRREQPAAFGLAGFPQDSNKGRKKLIF